MREIRTYGLIRGGCREAVAYFLKREKEKGVSRVVEKIG